MRSRNEICLRVFKLLKTLTSRSYSPFDSGNPAPVKLQTELTSDSELVMAEPAALHTPRLNPHAPPFISGAPSPTHRTPHSPWARKFGVSPHGHLLRQDGRSGLHPAIPDLPLPQYASEPREPPGEFLQPGDDALDALFLRERLQQLELAGLKTWQAVLVNRSLRGFIPGGHGGEPVIGPETDKDGRLPDSHLHFDEQLRIDDSRWTSCFKKERWCNFTKLIKQGLPSPHPGLFDMDMWSVDNFVVWNHMRPVIELANRILQYSCRLPL